MAATLASRGARPSATLARGRHICRALAGQAGAAPTGSNDALDVVLFMGSTRPNRLCMRVTRFMEGVLTARGHVVTTVDPCEIDLPVLVQPQFAYPAGKAPAPLDDLAQTIAAADAYVVVSPEYNHSAGVALTNTLAHFGGSLYAFKPSVICTYSAGQWGGVRAAMALRPILSEMGCLPVSATVAFPKVQDVLEPDGTCKDPGASAGWVGYAERAVSQMEWVGTAFKRHRRDVDPTDESPPNTAIGQRNAPGRGGG